MLLTRVWTAMSSKMQSSSSIAQAKRVVQQLRREACIERIKVPFHSHLFTTASVPGQFVNRFLAGVQGLVRPDAVLWRACQERPVAHGHPGLRKSFQGQEAVHRVVRKHKPPAALLWILMWGKKSQ